MPPNASPQRGPATSANQPTAGPPIVVVPRKAIDQNDITRPRICGELPNWMMLLPREVKYIEHTPANTRAIPERAKVGMKAAPKMVVPNKKPAPINMEGEFRF